MPGRITVDAGEKSEVKPARALARHQRRGARSVLRNARAAEIPQDRPRRGGSRARGGAPPRHGPAGRRVSRSPARSARRSTCRRRRRRTAGWRGSRDVLGADFRANAIAVEAERDGVRVDGFAGLPTLSRANTLGQYLFVNGRPVRDKLLVGAVRGAYADYLPRDRHPAGGAVRRRSSRARSTSTCIRPRPRCASATPGWCAALIVSALKTALAREGAARLDHRRQRHDRGVPPRCADRAARLNDWRRSPARPPGDAVGAQRCRARLCRSRASRLRRRRAVGRRARRKLRARAPICSTARSARRARRCMRPTSWRKRATGSSSSTSTPRMSGWSTSA